jgi:nitrate reductase NapAB chaperone NapD
MPYKIDDKNFTSFVSSTGWEYIRECTPDRRAIIKLDVRNYSQLEVREENTGKIVLVFNCNPDADEN